ncbi:MAG: NAD(P)H-binding protein [Ilyomonas sp.]
MQPQTAVVLGATGLIGGELVDQLLKDDTFTTVRILVRKPVELTHPKLETRVVDFNNQDDFKNKLGQGDCIFCCIGTTMKNVKGDKKLYRKIDHDIAVHAAQFGVAAGFTTYLLVSAVGANASSKNFYINLKGETEKDVAETGIKSLYIFQPSFLLGKRKEFRFAELMLKGIFKTISKLFSGSLTKYKAIEAADVAKAMITASKRSEPGTHTYTFKEMMR